MGERDEGERDEGRWPVCAAPGNEMPRGRGTRDRDDGVRRLK